MGIQVDIAAVITALSLLIGALISGVVALSSIRKGRDNNSDEKAVAVSQITETTADVKTLREQVDFLFGELATLKLEKQKLEQKVLKLTRDLKDERKDHKATKKALTEVRKQLKEKTLLIKQLESRGK